MTNTETIYQNIQKGETTYIFDDYEEAVIKIMPDGKNYIKPKGKTEFEIDSKAKRAFDIKLGGDIVSEEFYLNY